MGPRPKMMRPGRLGKETDSTRGRLKGAESREK